MQKNQLVTVYATSHTNEQTLPFNNRGRTIRMVLRLNIHTERLYLRFANDHGEAPLVVGSASVALCNKKGDLLQKALTVLVEKQRCFCLQPRQRVQSDAVCLAVKPGEYVAVSLYYPSEERVCSGNLADHLVLRSKLGDYNGDVQLPQKGLQKRLPRVSGKGGPALQSTTLCEVLAECETPHRVVVCLGDSITQQGSWTVPLRERFIKKFPGQMSLCNLGVGGGRLLQGPSPESRGLYGLSGMERFERDLLPLSGVTHVILALGSNDIGLPGSEGVALSQLPDKESYSRALMALAGTLREQNIHVLAATMCPRPLLGSYDAQREEMRKQWNDWIRVAPCFEAVLDFDSVLRKPCGELGIQKQYVLPDQLHPSPLGGLRLAQSVDLSLFTKENP